MSKFHVWTEPGRCSTCKYCAMDMDMDPYCTHPKVLEFFRYGVNISKAINDFCGEDLKLREPRLVEDSLQERHVGICLRCGATNPLKIEDCPNGKEIPGAGTEPHVFE